MIDGHATDLRPGDQWVWYGEHNSNVTVTNVERRADGLVRITGTILRPRQTMSWVVQPDQDVTYLREVNVNTTERQLQVVMIHPLPDKPFKTMFGQWAIRVRAECADGTVHTNTESFRLKRDAVARLAELPKAPRWVTWINVDADTGRVTSTMVEILNDHHLVEGAA